mgnify:FL=1
MDPISIRQYEKIFKPGGSPIKSPVSRPVTEPSEERLQSPSGMDPIATRQYEKIFKSSGSPIKSPVSRPLTEPSEERLQSPNGMDPISTSQYEKIFKSVNSPLSNTMPQPVTSPQDKLHSSIVAVISKVLSFKLDDEEFDNPQINVDSIESYSTETLYEVLTKKFARMVQLVQADEIEMEKVVENNNKFKEELDELMKGSEQIFIKAQEELKQILENNGQINAQSHSGKADIQNLQTQLVEREEEIQKLKISQKQVIDEFVLLRQKQQELAAKTDELKTSTTELRQHVEEHEGKVSEYEKAFLEKQREIERLRKVQKALEAEIKANTQKLHLLIQAINKKSSEEMKRMDEYKRIMERNSVFVKRIGEIEKEKEIVMQEIAQKTAEGNHVRSLNENYESRINKLKDIDNYSRAAKDRHYKLLTETEMIKRQINELAPHSLLDVTPKRQVSPKVHFPSFSKPSEGLSKEEEGLIVNTEPDELEKVVQQYKQQVKQNQMKIDELEESNSDKIQRISSQRSFITVQHNQYTDKLQEFSTVKAECENAVTECNRLESEIELLIRKFALISELLNKGPIADEKQSLNSGRFGSVQQDFKNSSSQGAADKKFTFGPESERYTKSTTRDRRLQELDEEDEDLDEEEQSHTERAQPFLQKKPLMKKAEVIPGKKAAKTTKKR